VFTFSLTTAYSCHLRIVENKPRRHERKHVKNNAFARVQGSNN
jgi:hypothetical protein